MLLRTYLLSIVPRCLVYGLCSGGWEHETDRPCHDDRRLDSTMTIVELFLIVAQVSSNIRAAAATAGWETMTSPMGPLSSSTFPGHESLSGEQSWWVDVDNDDKSDDDDEGRKQMKSPSVTSSSVKGDIVNNSRGTATTRHGPKQRWKDKLNRFRTKQYTNSSTSSSTTSSTSPTTLSATTTTVSGDDDTFSTTSPASSLTDVNDGSQLSSLLSKYDEEHPMRTDEWCLDIRLSCLSSMMNEGDYFFSSDNANDEDECNSDSSNNIVERITSAKYYRKQQIMQFARNGYVRVIDGDDRNGGSSSCSCSSSIRSGDISGSSSGKRKSKSRVGKWRIGHSGVAFDIPVSISSRGKGRWKMERGMIGGGGGGNCEDGNSSAASLLSKRMTVLHYHADIHLNKFGERPRMFRGVITRDRHSSFLPSNFLRPVVGTFSAEGIGHDTSDTSYKERAISLSRQQAINEARGSTMQ